MIEEDLKISVKASTGGLLPIRIRRSMRAKRVNLKIDTKAQMAELVLPKGYSTAIGVKFAEKNADWIEKHLLNLPPKQDFEIGGVIPLEGQKTLLHHDPRVRVAKLIDGDARQLHIGGPELGFARRVERYVRDRARESLTAMTSQMAKEMGVSPKAIRLKDTTSRWGSCSSAGALNYSWRLIFTPPRILRYVVVHECAHLIEMNHSADFWAIVERYDPNWRGHRGWLRQNGAALHAIG